MAGHQLRFYEDGLFPARGVARYLAEELHSGGAVLVLAGRTHLRALEQELAHQGLDLRQLAAHEQLRLLDGDASLAALHAADGQLSHARFKDLVGHHVRAALARFPRLRVFGELVDILCRDGRSQDALQLERWWNELRREQPFGLLCAYGLSSFADARSAQAFANVCSEHGDLDPAREQGNASAPEPGPVLLHLERQARALHGEFERVQRLEREGEGLRAAESSAARQAERARRHLSLLQGVTSALSEAASLSDVARVVQSRMLDATGASSGLLAVAQHDTGALSILTDQQASPAALQLCEQALTQRGPVRQSAPAADGHEALQAIALPLAIRGRPHGVLLLEFQPARALQDGDSALIEDLARQLALALDRAACFDAAELARTRAEEANRAKDEFLAMLGHELRNPLSPILTALDLMRQRSPDLLLQERAVIERQVQHMVRLVDDLLDVSRITRGAFELTRRRVELSEAVARSIEMVSPLLEERAHSLSCAVPESGLALHADPLRLAQVLSNLLTNAAKYTPPGGRIEVRACVVPGPRAPGDARVRLSVRDSGMGIEPALLPHVFEMFVQSPQALDRARGGLGLGLCIVRKLVELHGGTVSAESPGKSLGSTFSIELPLLGLHAAPATRPSRPPQVADAAKPGSALRVLVVDDNEDAGELLAQVLEGRGHEARVARDGPEALQLVADGFEPQLALLDIGLPVMDGYELAQQLRARLSAAPLWLVAVSGYGQRADVTRARQAGFDEHFVKPLSTERLLEVLARRQAALPTSCLDVQA